MEQNLVPQVFVSGFFTYGGLTAGEVLTQGLGVSPEQVG